VRVVPHPKQEQLVQSASFSATEAKNEFGRILEKAIRGETVVITKHDAPKAVLISMDQFNELKHAAELKLDTLSREFDALLTRMQAPKVRAAMDEAFHATPQQLGRAAVTAARKRG
jgi:prevent-host-death family protein